MEPIYDIYKNSGYIFIKNRFSIGKIEKTNKNPYLKFEK